MGDKEILVIYHANCADGFTSAWIARKFLMNDVETPEQLTFHPGVYGEKPPSCAGKEVYIVDFSYDLPTMRKICEEAVSVVMLDHHKTAFPTFQTLETDYPDSFSGTFDVNLSGAGICWDWFFPNEPTPMFVQIVQDRDLWKFRIPETRAVMAAIFSYPYDWKIWDDLANYCDNSVALAGLRGEGDAIMRKHDKDVRELVETFSYNASLGADGLLVRMCNIPYIYSSEAGHHMCEKYKKEGIAYACCYTDTKDGRVVTSLRSAPDGPDVSAIAKQWGGGGHKNAAGFTVDKKTWEIICKRVTAPSLRNPSTD